MLATLVLTILIFIAVLVVLAWVRTPRYRIQRHNVIALLELVLQGRASENDWRVFAAIPLRHNPALEEVRERCMDIEERDRKSTRLNSSHVKISYAVFCLKKKI